MSRYVPHQIAAKMAKAALLARDKGAHAATDDLWQRLVNDYMDKWLDNVRGARDVLELEQVMRDYLVDSGREAQIDVSWEELDLCFHDEVACAACERRAELSHLEGF